jgi:Na+/H+-dicarboxylate symporter
MGILSGSNGTPVTGRFDIATYAWVGTMMMQALKMLVVPLIATSIVVAVMGIASHHDFGRLGAKTLVYFLSTSMIAILIGLTLVNVIRPGAGIDQATIAIAAGSSEASQLAAITQKTEGRGGNDLLLVFESLIPENIFAASSKNDAILGVIFFSLVFGFFAGRLAGAKRETMVTFWEGTYAVMLGVTHFVLRFLPIGVCGLIAKTTADAVANQEFAARLTQLGLFALTVVSGLIIHSCVVMPLILRFMAQVSPWRQAKANSPALLTAFSTASSSATLPLTISCVEERAGVSRKICGFVLPLGATVNMDGTALYECVAAMFVLQTQGIHLGFGEQFLIVMLALLTSIGVAGIPSASLVAIVIILNAVGARVGRRPHRT